MTMPFIHQLSIANMIGSVLLVGYLIRSNWESAALPTGAGTSVQTTQGTGISQRSYVPTVKEVFSDLEAPLIESLLRRELHPQDILPQKEQLARAIATENIHSTESQEMLKRYEELYIEYELPFPALNPSTPSSTEETQANTKAEEQIISAYFQGQMLRIAKAANTQDVRIQDLIPTPQEIEDASKSGSISSPQSKLAITKIQATYKRLNIPFHSPVEE